MDYGLEVAAKANIARYKRRSTARSAAGKMEELGSSRRKPATSQVAISGARRSARISTPAITAQLAKGESLHAAVRRSIDYVHNAIASAPGLGSGRGPLNHLAADS